MVIATKRPQPEVFKKYREQLCYTEGRNFVIEDTKVFRLHKRCASCGRHRWLGFWKVGVHFTTFQGIHAHLHFTYRCTDTWKCACKRRHRQYEEEEIWE